LSSTSALRWLAFLAALAAGAPAGAQTLPSGPARALDGRLVLGGEIVATAGVKDDSAYFNFTDYQHDALKMVRVALSGLWRPADWLALVGEVHVEGVRHPEPFAAYVRLHPWRARQFDIQVGRIPPSFGAFGRRAYGTDRALIGYPLAYQYLTSLRTDAVPATADDLLRMRGRGWETSFPVGSPTEEPGLPLITAFRWDTGVQARWVEGPVELSGAVTMGTLSHARFVDDNDGKQVSGRVAVRPATGLVLGASGARGAWLSRNVPGTAGGSFAQSALGADFEYSRGYWIVRSELVWSSWALPFAVGPSTNNTVRALATWAEGRYRITPRLFAAARVDRLGFSHIPNPADGRRISWDGSVRRVETGIGWYLQRNLVGRLAVQPNWRDGGRVRQRTYVSAQVAYWF
jgi:hypothetical protein